MPHATLQDIETVTGQLYSAQEATRLTQMIAWAERDLADLASRDFYDALAPQSNPSQDWLLATALICERYLMSDDAEVKAALAGPYQSERIGDYGYTVKPNATDALSDARIQRIVLRNSVRRLTPYPAFATAGPAPLALPDVMIW